MQQRRFGKPLAEEQRKLIHPLRFPGMPLPPRGFGKLFPLEEIFGELGESWYVTIPPAGLLYMTEEVGILIPLLPFLPLLPILQMKVKE